MLALLAHILLLCLQQYAPVAPRLVVTPGDTTAGGPENGPYTPASISYALQNEGLNTLPYTVTCDANWITLTGASGTIGTRKTKSVLATIDSDADALAPGTHVATLQFTNTDNHDGDAFRIISLSISGGAMTPSTEWGGATAEPGQIGTGTAKCIARWDVVPHQVITEATTPTFTVGVVAFHIAGIAKVTFAIEGGSFVDVTQMSLNPITNVWEYCATFNLADFAADEEVELRAIAYPNAAAPQAEGTGAYPGGGYPRLLDSLYLWVDSDTARTPNIKYASVDYGSDSTGDGTEALPYKTIFKAAQAVDTAGGAEDANGGFVYLDGGSYTWDQSAGGATPVVSNRWLTIQPKPGIQPWQVVFQTINYNPGIGVLKVHFKNVTIRVRLDNPDASGQETWAESCIFRGAGPGTGVAWNGFLAGGARYWTDCEMFDDFGSFNGPLVRDCYAHEVSYATARPGLVVNSRWENLNDFGSDAHPDWFHWNETDDIQDNSIMYGCVGLELDAQGYFWKNTPTLKNVAIVNTVTQLTGSSGSPFGCGTSDTLDHLVLINNTHVGNWLWCGWDSVTATNVSVRGNMFSNMSMAGGAVPDSWFDHNHYQGGGFGAITPGTNVTTGDPGLDASFRPTPNSPLNNRMTNLLVPVDADGVLRTVNGSVGAYEVD